YGFCHDRVCRRIRVMAHAEVAIGADCGWMFAGHGSAMGHQELGLRTQSGGSVCKPVVSESLSVCDGRKRLGGQYAELWPDESVGVAARSHGSGLSDEGTARTRLSRGPPSAARAAKAGGTQIAVALRVGSSALSRQHRHQVSDPRTAVSNAG